MKIRNGIQPKEGIRSPLELVVEKKDESDLKWEFEVVLTFVNEEGSVMTYQLDTAIFREGSFTKASQHVFRFNQENRRLITIDGKLSLSPSTEGLFNAGKQSSLHARYLFYKRVIREIYEDTLPISK